MKTFKFYIGKEYTNEYPIGHRITVAQQKALKRYVHRPNGEVQPIPHTENEDHYDESHPVHKIIELHGMRFYSYDYDSSSWNGYSCVIYKIP